jgi:hypothetical protein
MEVVPASVLLKEVLRTVEQIGLSSTVTALQNARGLKELDHDIQFVLDAVAKELGTSVEKILNNHYSKTELRIYSIAFCCFYLINDFNKTTYECGTLFGLHRGTICRRKSAIEEISIKSKGEAKKYFETKNKLNLAIKKYKKENKN